MISISAHQFSEPSVTSDASDELARARQLHRLRTEIMRLQRPRGDSALLPLPSELSTLLPGGGLRVGAAYSLSPSPSLLAALLAPLSQQGAWCALIGFPTLGIEALAGFGVELARVALIPEPGARWLSITSALAEVFPVIALRPPQPATASEGARLHARLRVQRSTLLATGFWPQSEARLSLEDPQWAGLGAGWGLLSHCTVTVCAESAQGARRVRVLLPGAQGALAPLLAQPAEADQDRPRLRVMPSGEPRHSVFRGA